MNKYLNNIKINKDLNNINSFIGTLIDITPFIFILIICDIFDLNAILAMLGYISLVVDKILRKNQK